MIGIVIKYRVDIEIFVLVILLMFISGFDSYVMIVSFIVVDCWDLMFS